MTSDDALAIRPAGAGDSRLVYAWRNDPDTRAASISRDEIAWPDHEAWFERVLADPDRVLSMGLDGAGTPFAVCRFDTAADGSVEVSINLDPAARGHGLAFAVLDAAIADYLQRSGEAALTATIREDNLASIRIFERLGFRRLSATDGIGHYRRDS